MNNFKNYGRMILKELMNDSMILNKNNSSEHQLIIEINHLGLLFLSKYAMDNLSECERKELLIAKLDYKKNILSVQKVIQKLSDSNIDYRMIKGVLNADAYPLDFSRLFGDHDILIRKQDLDKALLVINSCSYHEKDDIRTTKDISLFKDHFKKIELHFDISDKANEMTDDIQELIWASNYEYSIDGKQIKGPNPKTHLIYMVYHILKHFDNAGFGLRHLIDLKYFIEKHNIDLIEVDGFFQKYGYEKFFRSLIVICVDELKLNFDYNFFGWERSDILQETFFEYVLRVGTFAKASKESVLTNLYESKLNGSSINNKWGVFAKVMFPSKQNLIKQYPYLSKGNFFLPAAWINRWIDQFHNENFNFKEKMFAFTLDKSLLNSRVYLLKEFGLRNHE